VRDVDSGVGERNLLVSAEKGDVAEGVDLDGAPDAGSPQRGRDAGAEADGAGAGREPAHDEVPPHRDLDRPPLLVPVAGADAVGWGGGVPAQAAVGGTGVG
jgi:hypothetical protein